MTEKTNLTLSWIHYRQSEKVRQCLFILSYSMQQGPPYSILGGASLVSYLDSKSI